MKIIADENMPGLACLAGHASVTRVSGRGITPELLREADALLVRSVTRVDQSLLAGSSVRFVGSATIGTDHLDRHWLAQAGIEVAWAPGCNAMAVAEYVLQSVLAWLLERGEVPTGVTVGLVGAGNVGARVGWLLEALGCQVRFCDPPRQAGGEAPPVGQWSGLDELLDSKVVSLHVPLTAEGPWATAALFDSQRLARLDQNQLLVNTCRGAVVDNAALIQRLAQPAAPAVVLDVWENEPTISASLCRRVRVGTPHIAGYSVEGKLRGTAMVLDALAAFSGGRWTVPWPAGSGAQLADSVTDTAGLLALLRGAYRPETDHSALLASLDTEDAGAAFDQLRRHYPARHELGGNTVGTVADDLATVVRRLGIGWGTVPASFDPAAQWLTESCSR